MTALGLRGVSLAALNRTHDKKLTAHLFLSALMPRPHARSDDIFQHSSALNRTQPALMANFTKKLSYQETAHLRVGTSLDPLDDPSASPHRLWRSWRQRCQSFRNRHAALRHQRNSLRIFSSVERCQAYVESVLRAFTYRWPKKSYRRR